MYICTCNVLIISTVCTWGSKVLIPEYPHTTAPTDLAGPERCNTLLLTSVTGVTSSFSDRDS